MKEEKDCGRDRSWWRSEDEGGEEEGREEWKKDGRRWERSREGKGR